MDIIKIRSLAQQIIAEVDGPPVPVPVPVPPTSTRIRVTAGALIQSAIAKAPDRSTLVLDNGGSYVGEFTLDRGVRIEALNLPPAGARVLRGFGFPLLISSGDTVTLKGVGAGLVGVRVRSTNVGNTLVSDIGQGTLIDRVYGAGDPNRGQHRGLMAHGQGSIYIGSIFDDCFDFQRDAEAIAGWDGTRAVAIDDCEFGGGISMMWGGADSSAPTMVPEGIVVTRTDLTAKPKWITMGAQVKCRLEFKACRRFSIDKASTMKYASDSAGHAGFLVVATVRNQDGRAPWSEIRDIEVYAGGSSAAGICNFLGVDDTPGVTSGRLSNFKLSGRYTDMGGTYRGTRRLFQFNRGADKVTLENIQVVGSNLDAWLYGVGNEPPTGLVAKDIIVPKSLYGIAIDDMAPGEASLRAWAPDVVLDRVVEA